MAIPWKKHADGGWRCTVEPGERFALEVRPKGDGRWSWSVIAGAATAPMATGVANSLGAAKNTVEQLLKRIS